jgi:hypothetical protein
MSEYLQAKMGEVWELDVNGRLRACTRVAPRRAMRGVTAQWVTANDAGEILYYSQEHAPPASARRLWPA